MKRPASCRYSRASSPPRTFSNHALRTELLLHPKKGSMRKEREGAGASDRRSTEAGEGRHVRRRFEVGPRRGLASILHGPKVDLIGSIHGDGSLYESYLPMANAVPSSKRSMETETTKSKARHSVMSYRKYEGQKPKAASRRRPSLATLLLVPRYRIPNIAIIGETRQQASPLAAGHFHWTPCITQSRHIAGRTCEIAARSREDCNGTPCMALLHD
jgi:hypothetical protein